MKNFKPARPNLNLSKHPVIRLPVGNEIAGFSFPAKTDAQTRARFASRKIPIISKKQLKNPGMTLNDIKVYPLRPFIG